MRTWKLKVRLEVLLLTLSLIFLSVITIQSNAQTPRKSTRKSAPPIASAPAQNPDIVRIVSGIDARNIELTIRKLVSFGTRNTLSGQSDPNRGIGAARDWLFAEFRKI